MIYWKQISEQGRQWQKRKDKLLKSLRELNESGKKVFIPFPNPSQDIEKCKCWLMVFTGILYHKKHNQKYVYLPSSLAWRKSPTADFLVHWRLVYHQHKQVKHKLQRERPWDQEQRKVSQRELWEWLFQVTRIKINDRWIFCWSWLQFCFTSIRGSLRKAGLWSRFSKLIFQIWVVCIRSRPWYWRTKHPPQISSLPK